MKKGLIWAMLILVLSVLVLIFNKGNVNVNLLICDISAMKSIVFLAFISVGVAIGVLIK
ncbi:MAG: hypothetical protein PHR77_18075 [Kiritimatiellae bacterium]|nr:hypothetical protein [Kiritimatiellia bacterium]MDD5521460.1 hypothetical protein [Kiritimatiellia bacterium]